MSDRDDVPLRCRPPLPWPLVLGLWAVSFTVAGVCAQGSPPVAEDRDPWAAPGDSLKTYAFGEVLVAAPSPELIAEPGATEVPAAIIDERDVEDAGDIAPLVPAARVGTNSRGEANLTLRGASERQIAIFQDGVRLNLAWDERVDLSFVPMEAVGTLRVVRGFHSVLDGPNTLGGVVHLISRDLDTDGTRTRLLADGGEAGRVRLGALQLARQGRWSGLAAVEHRRRDGFLLPAGFDSEHNQSPRRLRTNSDLEQTSLLLRAARHLERGGTVGLSFHGMESEKGVPPETHLGVEDARYWRVPTWRRGLLGLQVDLVPDEERLWSVHAGASLDLFRQVIQDYPDSTYSADPAALASGRETGEDVTGELRFRLARANDRRATRTLSAAASVRGMEYTEATDAGEDVYTQFLWGAATEWDGRLSGPWSLRLGAGLDGASTPRTAGRPEQDPDLAPSLALRLSRDLTANAQLHLTAGRRARFPSLRERYDDAGGVFQVNPELDPEEQSTVEIGGGWRSFRGSFSAGAFFSLLEDGIVRVSLLDDAGDRVRRRVNSDRIRTLGLELSGQWPLSAGWDVDGHVTLLHVRARSDGGEYDARVERKPEYGGALNLRGEVPSLPSLELQIEGILQGPFHSLDDRTGELVRLDPTATANLRLAYRFTPTRERAWGGSVFLRLDNLLDAERLSQLGLPEPGRELRAGLRLER